MSILKQAYLFKTDAQPVSCSLYGNGHINLTYLLVDSAGSQYILQKINANVFSKPQALMENVASVTEHMRKKASNPREALTLVPTKDKKLWLVDEDGEYWRTYRFINDSMCLEQVQTPQDFYESGRAFGRFQRQLSDFPVQTLIETIPHFHNTKRRYIALQKAIKDDICARAKDVKNEIEFALKREEYAGLLTKLQAQGNIPLRVTHNDAKLNNVLFDRNTRKTLCVIDLDTVMPGLSINDFGDSIRFGASTALEDELDLSKVKLSLELYGAYTQGFLSACGKSLTVCEREHLRDGAKMMTLECGVRFLTDYLSGDTYFRTSREKHNLDRCRTQFKLVEEMENAWDEMQHILKGVPI